MALLSDNDAKEVTKIFNILEQDVQIKVYTQKSNCPSCEVTESILKELAGLSDKLKISYLDIQNDKNEAEKDDVGRAPAVVVSDGSHSRVRFYGAPSGHEFSSLLTAIVDSGGKEEPLGKETIEFLDNLDRDIDLLVFVTPQCPYCPASAVLANRLARYSNRVNSAVIEANEFPELSNEFKVQGVPRTVANKTLYAEGALPEEMLINALKKGLEDNPSGETNLMQYVENR